MTKKIGQDILLEKGYNSLVSVDEEGTMEVVKEWLTCEYDPLILLTKLSDAMTEVGIKFEKMEYYLPHVIIDEDNNQAASKELAYKMTAAGETAKHTGTVVIGTIEGDIHDLGKNIVAGMLKASGFKIVNLGRDVAVSRMIESAIENKADIIAGSALMTSTMPYLGDIINRLNARN